MEQRSFSQRCADSVTEFCGSWAFVIVFTVIILAWVAFNTIWLLVGKFDEYPFIALNLVLTIVSTMQGPLIMMSQNRQAERDRQIVHDLHEKLDEIIRREKAIDESLSIG